MMIWMMMTMLIFKLITWKCISTRGGDTYFNLGLSHANEPLQWLQQCQSQSFSNGTSHKLQWYTHHHHIKFVEQRKIRSFFLSSASVPHCGTLSPLPLFHDQMQWKYKTAVHKYDNQTQFICAPLSSGARKKNKWLHCSIYPFCL